MNATAALLLLALMPPLLDAQADRFGLPACEGPEVHMASRSFFTLCYNSGLKVPLWAGHELRPEQLQAAVASPRSHHFRTDPELPGPGARNDDYRGSGYSRGHLAPAGDFAWSEEARRATYVLSNAIPQRQSVNGGRWRQLESAIRAIAAGSDAAYVFTGPIFANRVIETIGAGQVAVPTHTFKVVLAISGESKTMYAAILPNAATNGEPIESFTTSVDEVERLTGLDFFSALGDTEEDRLEATMVSAYSKPNS